LSGITDALKAIKKAILLEERISSQGKKLEQLAENVVEMDKRLTLLEGRMDGFFSAATAFGAGARRPTKLIEAAAKERAGVPPGKES
jgi:uncharacterized coiled-coil protein SlyX